MELTPCNVWRPDQSLMEEDYTLRKQHTFQSTILYSHTRPRRITSTGYTENPIYNQHTPFTCIPCLNFIFHLHKYLSENGLFQFFKLPISLSNSFKVTKCKVLNKCFLCVWGALLFNNFPLVRCPTKPYQRKKTCQPYKKVVYQVIYQAQNIVFHHYMKHLEKSWEYDMQQSILDELRGVSSSDETHCHMLDAS